MSALPKSFPLRLAGAGACLLALVLVQMGTGSGGAVGAPGNATRLLGVLGLLCAGAFVGLRKLQRAPAAPGALPALQVVGRTSLGPRHGLALVEADGMRVLVTFGEGFAQVLPLDGPPPRQGSGS